MYKIILLAIMSSLTVTLFLLVAQAAAQDPIVVPGTISPTTQIWISVIGGLISLIGTCFTAWITLQQSKLNTKTDRIEAVATRAEGYANSALGVQLDSNAQLSRERATKSGNAGDLKAAELAEFRADSHRLEKERVEAVMALEKKEEKAKL